MIKNYVIIVLSAIVAFFLITDSKPVESVVIKTDTLHQQKTFTKYKKGNDIQSYIIKVDSVYIPVHDTIKIINDYYAIKAYTDTLRIDTNNSVYIQDTISRNSIIGRSFIAHITEKTIEKTITSERKPKNALYLGFLGDFRQDIGIDGAGLGFMYKVKDKALIGLNLKAGQGVKYGFGVYLKL